jgi:spermidine/putrescine transport system permease protein
MGSFLKRHHWITPLALLTPGLLWLIVFFFWPAFQMFMASFWSGTLGQGFEFSLENWVNYPNSITQFAPWYGRSLLYGGAATLTTFLIAYPLAYTIAFKGGRYKNLLLFMVVAPFFTSFLLRTISWKILLGDEGPILGPLKDIDLNLPLIGWHITGLSEDFHILATPMAVIAGITYNFLPFMTLPIYVALEKIDIRLVEAAKDLYAGPWRPGGAITGAVVGGLLMAALGLAFNADWPVFAVIGAAVGALIAWFLISESFVRVTFPLSLSGVFAGGLLTFIPAIGDYINAELLGNTDTNMIGNVIQNKFLTQNDYPIAAALSFTMMAGVLIVVAIYARILGTEELSSAAARV